MECMLVILGVIFSFIAGFIMCNTVYEERGFFNDILSLILIIIGFVCIVYAIENIREIPAIEVYRGNTTLKITYQDGIPVDTVVVYKTK